MSAATITAIVQMLESLPDDLQEQLAKYIRAYITEQMPAKQSQRAAFGVAKGSGKILCDIIEPVLPLSTWEVFQ
jgi:hypothetical protein